MSSPFRSTSAPSYPGHGARASKRAQACESASACACSASFRKPDAPIIIYIYIYSHICVCVHGRTHPSTHMSPHYIYVYIHAGCQRAHMSLYLYIHAGCQRATAFVIIVDIFNAPGILVGHRTFCSCTSPLLRQYSMNLQIHKSSNSSYWGFPS